MSTAKPLRVYHGPVNVAGIGGYLSHYEREAGAASDFITYHAHKYHTFNEQSLGYGAKGLKRLIFGFFFFFKALFRYDVFHFYFGTSFWLTGLDLPLLRLFGKKIVMTYCGSEVRLIGPVESKRNPYYKEIFDHPGSGWFKRQFDFRKNFPNNDGRKMRMMRWHRRWVHKFIAIRDNYAYANHVIPAEKIVSDILINNISVSEPMPWTPTGNDKVTIVHAPTNKKLKGTAIIEGALEKLREKGLEFEYVPIVGKPFETAKQMTLDADVVIDQVLLGGVGSVTIEAMSYAKPVAVFLLPEVMEKHCPDLPIWNINPDDITEKLEMLIRDAALRAQLGKAGAAYIGKYYDREMLARKMIELYQSL